MTKPTNARLRLQSAFEILDDFLFRAFIVSERFRNGFRYTVAVVRTVDHSNGPHVSIGQLLIAAMPTVHRFNV